MEGWINVMYLINGESSRPMSALSLFLSFPYNDSKLRSTIVKVG